MNKTYRYELLEMNDDREIIGTQDSVQYGEYDESECRNWVKSDIALKAIHPDTTKIVVERWEEDDEIEMTVWEQRPNGTWKCLDRDRGKMELMSKDLEQQCQKYKDDGMPQWVIDSILSSAWDQGHSAGEDEVERIAEGMLSDFHRNMKAAQT